MNEIVTLTIGNYKRLFPRHHTETLFAFEFFQDQNQPGKEWPKRIILENATISQIDGMCQTSKILFSETIHCKRTTNDLRRSKRLRCGSPRRQCQCGCRHYAAGPDIDTNIPFVYSFSF